MKAVVILLVSLVGAVAVASREEHRRLQGEYVLIKSSNYDGCIELRGGVATDDSVLILGPCTPEQAWRYDEDGRFHAFTDDSKCMQAARGGTIEDGSKMRVFPCDTTRADQVFEWDAGESAPIQLGIRPDLCGVFRGVNAMIDQDNIILKECDSINPDRLPWKAVPVSPPTTKGGTLLALGDSLCTGQLPEPKNTIFVSDEGYVDTLFEYLKENYDFDALLKICCPGEGSAEMIDANANEPPSDGSFCYGNANPDALPSQLDAAVEALQSGTVRLISISIGANDIFSCVFASNPEECATTQIQAFVDNLVVILTVLTEATENMPPIVAMTPYNPILAYALSENENEQALAPASQAAVVGLQKEAGRVYDSFNVPTVFGQVVFDGLNETLVDGIPQNVVNICMLTGMCNETDSGYILRNAQLRDIHATPEGYETLGVAHFELVDGLL